MPRWGKKPAPVLSGDPGLDEILIHYRELNRRDAEESRRRRRHEFRSDLRTTALASVATFGGSVILCALYVLFTQSNVDFKDAANWSLVMAAFIFVAGLIGALAKD